MEAVEHDGRTTAYRSVGDDVDGPTALYVHGSGGTHRLWSRQYAPGGPTRSTVAIDLSGHGESEDVSTPPGPDTLDAYAADVVAVAEATGADVLVGNSLGGAVVLQTLLDDRFAPAAVVLAGTGAKLAVLDALRDDLADDFDAAVGFLHGEDRLFHDVPRRVRDNSVESMRSVGRRVTRRDFETCHRFDVRDRLGEIEPPTLAVCGEYDRLTPPAYHEYLAERLAHGTFEEIPDAAHLAMVERPGAFNRAVRSFLDG